MSNLKALNEAQREAVEHTEGPLLILAGAGAGKTRVITHRIVHLMKNGVAPEHILAVTFTNKAARQMRNRAEELVRSSGTLAPGAPLSLPQISTFHALAVRMLRTHARVAGVPARFSIFDRDDSIKAIKEAMRKTATPTTRFEPRKILGTISRQKGDGVTLGEYASQAGSDFYPRIVAGVWEIYEELLRERRALDFDDLLLKTMLLLRDNSAVRTYYQELFRYIHVDEYQDTNHVQYEIAKLVAGDRKNICVVGDLDQCIYTWRGADLENLLMFETTYPNAKVVLLEQNYRSTKTILEASNRIIEKNVRRRPKTLFTENNEGERIELANPADETEEALFVAARAKGLIETGVAPREIAVLYRANFQSRALEEAFLSLSVPYQVLGVRFLERKEVKDVLAFIRAAQDPTSAADLARIINVPPRGIGKATLLKMMVKKEHELSGTIKKRVFLFRELLTRINSYLATKSPSEVVKFIIRESGLEEVLRKGTDDDIERLENLRELVTLASRYDSLPSGEGLEEFLTDVALAGEQDKLNEDRDAVRLMTAHASKGLEFDHVFITGLEEGLFPHQALSDERSDEEEERRLFYVALTRARKKVILSFASSRTLYGSRSASIPSEFITDIDEHLLEPSTGEEPQQVIEA